MKLIVDGDIDFEDTFKHSIKIEEWNKTILNCILKKKTKGYMKLTQKICLRII